MGKKIKKIILIILTVFVLGPLVFVGTCIPVSLFVNFVGNSMLISFGSIFTFLFSIYVIFSVLKNISQDKVIKSDHKIKNAR